ncbi:alpha-ribazole phosphatase [Lachnospiraceae bacterium XBB1006]|nr:alpha-ribazole phosphatase [Lachnospiraceae bacterium XBB1006]
MRNRDGHSIELFLIRHGETLYNKEGRYLGVTDLPLTKEAQQNLVKQEMPQVEFLFASPMLRARQTADIVFPKQPYVVMEEFAEMNFGEFEGKNYRELNGNPAYQAYIDSGGSTPFPGGESRDAFVMRTMTGFTKVLMQVGKEERPVRVGIVAHGGTVMAIASSLLGGEYFSYRVQNGGYLHLRGYREEKRKITWNIIS